MSGSKLILLKAMAMKSRLLFSAALGALGAAAVSAMTSTPTLAMTPIAPSATAGVIKDAPIIDVSIWDSHHARYYFGWQPQSGYAYRGQPYNTQPYGWRSYGERPLYHW